MLLLHHYQPLMAAAVAKFPSEPWVALGAEVGVPLQPLRSPEEALHDPAFLADGCVIEVVDPDARSGPSGGPGLRAPRVPDRRAAPRRRPSAPTPTTVRAEADALTSHRAAASTAPSRRGSAGVARSPGCACSTSGSRSRDRGAR